MVLLEPSRACPKIGPRIHLGRPSCGIPGHGIGLFLCLSAMLAWPAWAEEAADPSPKSPYFDARRQRTEYRGPEGPRVALDQISEVRIGYFGPSDASDPIHGRMWQAARAAVKRANEDGGYQGKPFRLLPVWSENPWGSGVKKLTQLVYEQNVWAIVGGVDGPSTHLAEQVVTKARLPLISPLSTDKTVNLANVPWMFSLAPGDHRIAKAMIPSIIEVVADKPFVIISGNDHDSFLLTRELRKSLNRLTVVPEYQMLFGTSNRPENQVDEIVRKSLTAHPAAVVAIAGVKDSLQVVRRLRQRGFDQPIFAGPRVGHHEFLEHIGPAAGDIRFPVLIEPSRLCVKDATCLELIGDEPDYASLHTFDAVTLIVEAIRRGGLNRSAINRALRENSPRHGTSGRIHWDGLGGNTREVRMGTVREGRVELFPNGT
ncbi:MAG: ABC transporter substrate-binding protein [Planctomycetota bacterium]